MFHNNFLTITIKLARIYKKRKNEEIKSIQIQTNISEIWTCVIDLPFAKSRIDMLAASVLIPITIFNNSCSFNIIIWSATKKEGSEIVVNIVGLSYHWFSCFP